MIAWQMAQGFDTLGFNVFREANGARIKLNDALVPAKALSGGAGERYSFVDPGPPESGRIYWVENVTFSLDSRWYGPVAPVAAPDCASIVVAGPARPGVPTASPAGVGPAAPAESATDQVGGCAVTGEGGRGSAGVPLALVALALVGLRRRRRS